MSRTKQQRIQEQQKKPAASPVKDSYQNLAARIGLGSGNLGDAGTYQINPVTRERASLEYMYRGSWIAGIAVDAVADDMTRAGVDFGQSLPPGEVDTLVGAFESMQLWQAAGDTIRWARLYGGAVGVMLIDGQDTSTPLRTEAIGKGSFKGLLVLDRWSLIPNIDKYVSEFGPDLGKPEVYTVGVNSPALRGKKVHYSRVIRFDGVALPYQQRLAEQGWGMSVIERMYDRMLAFDSSTQAAAQLIYKAHYRILSIEGLNKILAIGGPGMEALAKNVEAIRLYQSTEGLTLIDAKDKMDTQTYTFSGLGDMLLQFGQQISGNLQIPMVRLFGQSPVGMNATGESDLRTYYDGIASQQESKLRVPIARLIDVVYRSVFGKTIPEGFRFGFNPLWQMSDKEKAETAETIGRAVSQQVGDGTISRATGLKELKQSADVTGVFSNISAEDIKEAEDEPPIPSENEVIPEPPAPKPVEREDDPELAAA